jgi:hypothetical protein
MERYYEGMLPMFPAIAGNGPRSASFFPTLVIATIVSPARSAATAQSPELGVGLPKPLFRDGSYVFLFPFPAIETHRFQIRVRTLVTENAVCSLHQQFAQNTRRLPC